MAEGFLRHMASDKFQVFSAGVKPTKLNAYAVKVMFEVGIDISSHQSKSVDKFLNQKFDFVITVCDNAKQTCPLFSGWHQKIHWDIEDPADVKGSEEEKLIFFRKVRDKIRIKCQGIVNNVEGFI